jgi:hypothetical protein
MAGYWEALFPGEIPMAGEKVLPQLLTCAWPEVARRRGRSGCDGQLRDG